VLQRREVVGLDRRERLVRLLEEMSRERAVCLLSVPRTAAGRAELRHHADELGEPGAERRRRSLAALGHGEGEAEGEAEGAAEGVAEAAAEGVAELVEVLVIASTAPVCSLRRP